MHRATLGSGAGALSPAVATWMRTGGRRRLRPREQGLPHPLELGTPPGLSGGSGRSLEALSESSGISGELSGALWGSLGSLWGPSGCPSGAI